MKQTRILVVDDNPEIREIIRILLTGEGYAVEEAADGAAALDAIKDQDFDLIILDIMMPGINGYQTCLKLRERSNTPVLFLSARTKECDQTMGFSSGGDDYLAKPFSYNELINRSKALIRRYQVYQGKTHTTNQSSDYESQSQDSRFIHYRDLELDTTQREVRVNGRYLELTDTEYGILRLLLQNQKRIFSAEHLYESVWDEPYYYGANNTVMVHIRNLRLKIEKDPKNPQYIRNVFGKGYYCE